MQKLFRPPYVKSILISKSRIERAINKAARWIEKEYAHCKKPPILLAVLRGSIPFYTKLVMNLHIDCCLDFILMSSFCGGLKAAQKPKIITDLSLDIRNRDVIIVDDVLDSARSTLILIKHLKRKGAKSVKIVVLVNKPAKRKLNIHPDFACFTLKGSPFLIGYGLDIKEVARNIPYIADFKTKYINKL